MENITKKEVWIGVAVTLIVLAMAVFFEPFLKDGMMKEIRLYQDALRVDNDAKMFSYAQTTNVGNVLAYGDIEALQPQRIDDLLQSYMAITKVKEHYTEHSRQVLHESCTGTGKNEVCETYYTTEYYWTWDSVAQWNWVSPNYKFLNVEFQYDQLQLPSYQHLELNDQTINSKYNGLYDNYNLYEGSRFSDDRYYFTVLPVKFSTTIFVRFIGDTTINPVGNSKSFPILAGQKPDQIIQKKKNGLVIFDWFYYVLIGVLTIIIWLYLAEEVFDIV